MKTCRRAFLTAIASLSLWRIRVGRADLSSAGLIIDFRKDPWRGRLYDIFDAHTGEKLNGLRIWYADERRGIIRRYPKPVRIERGEVVSEELRRDIRIRLKSRWRSEAEGLAHYDEHWRRFRDGLEADLS